MIGDRALAIKENYKYVYDLSAEWYSFTGLPFVFACWVANKPLNENTVAAFSKTLQQGIDNRKQILAAENIVDESQQNYLLNTIVYKMDTKHKEALSLFLKMSQSLE